MTDGRGEQGPEGKGPRWLALEDYRALKFATRDAVAMIGSQSLAIQSTRIGQQHLSKLTQTDPQHDDFWKFATLDVAQDLQDVAGRPVIAEAMAAQFGYVMVHVPEVAKSRTVLGRVTGEAMKETSEVFSALGIRLADNHVSQEDYAAVHAEIRQALAALIKLDMQLEAEAKRG